VSAIPYSHRLGRAGLEPVDPLFVAGQSDNSMYLQGISSSIYFLRALSAACCYSPIAKGAIAKLIPAPIRKRN